MHRQTRSGCILFEELKAVGFLFELRHGMPNGPSLSELRRPTPKSNESDVVDYLSSGQIYIASPGRVKDIDAPEAGVIGSGSILADGEWAWPDDLPHYVRAYHVALTEEFLAHAKANGWKVPKVDESSIVRMTFERTEQSSSGHLESARVLLDYGF